MKLRLGDPINATDAPFGELADIVVDPLARTVTHIVVEPVHRHYQARLVPIWLVTEEAGVLTVQLDTAHMRQLARVAMNEYVQMGESVHVDNGWDIGTEDVVYMPYQNATFEMGWHDDHVGIAYDRIPKGECEIRRESGVATSDGKTVGRVEGFVAEDQHLTAIVVQTGLPGFRHSVLVPFGSVDNVRTDMITLAIDKDHFQKLPRTGADGEEDERRTDLGDLQHKVEAIGARVAGEGRKMVSAASSRLRGDK